MESDDIAGKRVQTLNTNVFGGCQGQTRCQDSQIKRVQGSTPTERLMTSAAYGALRKGSSMQLCPNSFPAEEENDY